MCQYVSDVDWALALLLQHSPYCYEIKWKWFEFHSVWYKIIFKNVPQRLVNEQKAVYGHRTAT